MNQTQLVGHLGADPDLRHTKSGTAVCTVRIATKERRKIGDEWNDATEWHNVKIWGKSAENFARYCSKGSQVGIVGRLETEPWQDRDGNKRYTTYVVAREVEYLSKSESRPRDERQGTEPTREPEPKPWSPTAGPDDDIPF